MKVKIQYSIFYCSDSCSFLRSSSNYVQPLEEINATLDREGENIKTLRGYNRLNSIVKMFLHGIKVNIEIMNYFKPFD